MSELKQLTNRPALRHRLAYFNQGRTSSCGVTTSDRTCKILCQSSTIRWHPCQNTMPSSMTTSIFLALHCIPTWWEVNFSHLKSVPPHQFDCFSSLRNQFELNHFLQFGQHLYIHHGAVRSLVRLARHGRQVCVHDVTSFVDALQWQTQPLLQPRPKTRRKISRCVETLGLNPLFCWPAVQAETGSYARPVLLCRKLLRTCSWESCRRIPPCAPICLWKSADRKWTHMYVHTK